MRRRELLGLAAAVAAWPRLVSAQAPTVPVIGFLATRGEKDDPQLRAAYREGLTETGFIEGRNLAIEYRFAANRYDRLPALAAELVEHRVSLIQANGPAARAAKTATATIPIVFTAGFDPVAAGLVDSLSRPGGNVTGMTVLDVRLGSKRLELLHQILPDANLLAGMVNPSDPARADMIAADLRMAAHALGVELRLVQASADEHFEPALQSLAQQGVRGLVIGGEPFFNSRSEKLGGLTLRHAIPAVFQFRSFVQGGGLASYGASLVAMYRQAGIYAGRILKGESPAALPIQQPTTFELALNMKTAAALGLKISSALLARADEVLE